MAQAGISDSTQLPPPLEHYPTTAPDHQAFAPHSAVPADNRPITGDAHVNQGFHIVDNGGTHNAHPLTPGDHHFTTVVDGKQRDFEIHVPKGYDGSKPYPVVYLMPGMGGSIDQMKHETGMNNRNDAIMVYTQALPKDFPNTHGLIKQNSWNLSDGSLTNKVGGYDDLNYIKKVDQLVSQQVNVDKHAQYIAGFSEGGGAAQYVAEQMPGKFAAVASVHGTYLEGDEKPQPHSGTSFIEIHGTDDHMLPIEGGKGFMTLPVTKASLSRPEEQISNWAAANGLTDKHVSQSNGNIVVDYPSKNGEVEQMIRVGGEHAWDGKGLSGKADYGWMFVGEPDTNQDTTRDIMNFFNAHRR